MFTGLLGSSLGAVAGLGTSLYGTHTSKREARAADERSMQNWLSQMVYGNLYGPSLQRRGLEKAGYNSMLALDKSGFSSGAPATHAGSPSISDVVSSARAGRELAKSLGEMFELEKEQVKANVDKTKSETELNKVRRFSDFHSKPLSDLWDFFIPLFRGKFDSSRVPDGEAEIEKIMMDGMNILDNHSAKSLDEANKERLKHKRKPDYKKAFLRSTSYHYD